MDDRTQVLIDRIQRGDQSAIDALLLRHLPSLERYVQMNIGPAIRRRESDSDLVQSVCRQVLENLDGFEYRGEGAFTAWLNTLTLRKIMDRERFYRREKRDVNREVRLPGAGAQSSYQGPSEPSKSMTSPSQHAAAREQVDRLEFALTQLPAEHREIVRAVQVNHEPIEEVAARTNRSVDSIRKLVGRSLLRLARLLGEEDSESVR